MSAFKPRGWRAKLLDFLVVYTSPTATEFGPFDICQEWIEVDSQDDDPTCPQCGGQLILQEARNKPS